MARRGALPRNVALGDAVLLVLRLAWPDELTTAQVAAGLGERDWTVLVQCDGDHTGWKPISCVSVGVPSWARSQSVKGERWAQHVYRRKHDSQSVSPTLNRLAFRRNAEILRGRLPGGLLSWKWVPADRDDAASVDETWLA